MKIVAFLPAKGTSDRVPGKNTKLLNGKPLFLHTLEKLCYCDFIDEVYLDSESDEILFNASYLPYKPFKRDAILANNDATGDMLIYNEASSVKADIYVQIFCPFPFIKKETIKKGIDILLQNSDFDSVVLIKKDKLYLWENEKPAYYTEGRIPNSVDLPDTIHETMGLYITRYEVATKLRSRIGKKPYLLEAEPIEAIDINTPSEFEMAEQIARGIQGQERHYLNSIKHFFSSADFSDVFTEMKLNKVITGLTLNLPGKKIFGRANTMKIRALREGEDYKNIYEALKTYSKMQCGDIIVVENEFNDKAYFGNINANIAIRAGAIGTIVSGKTRDIEAVNTLDYPVFSTGYSANDIRGIGIFDSHNKPINIKNVTINPGDFIFADINGICIIPRGLEDIVIKRAKEKIIKEQRLLDEILDNKDAYDIYCQNGEF